MDVEQGSQTLLTIAGFDPSSGAGITADLTVFAAHGCFGTSAVTALTVQSTTGVRRVQPVSSEMLLETLLCLEDDLPPAGVKIGMLADRPQVAAVAKYLQRLETSGRDPWVVLDPVLRSSSGKDLLTVDGRACLLECLLPLVDTATPNTEELADLTGMRCDTDQDIEAAARAFSNHFENFSVLVTGGHRRQPDDVLLHGGVLTTLHGTRVETSATHGTGCALSSALLCGLVNGLPLTEAAAAAKRYVEAAMRLATPHGAGQGPLHLLWPLLKQAEG